MAKAIETISDADKILEHEMSEETIRSIGHIALVGAELDDRRQS